MGNYASVPRNFLSDSETVVDWPSCKTVVAQYMKEPIIREAGVNIDTSGKFMIVSSDSQTSVLIPSGIVLISLLTLYAIRLCWRSGYLRQPLSAVMCMGAFLKNLCCRLCCVCSDKKDNEENEYLRNAEEKQEEGGNLVGQNKRDENFLFKDERKPKKPPVRNRKIRSERIDEIISSRRRDTETYRNRYPGLTDSRWRDTNLKFYGNKIASTPDGNYIEKIHDTWFGNYDKLEIHHGYIQWLFPIRESGMNFQAQELQLHEAQAIKADDTLRARVLRSYELMLDFYGIQLKDREIGLLERSPNWKERFAHLNKSFHNYLRITRILKCLGELGFESLKRPFVEFMLNEVIKNGTLPNCFDSCIGFWVMVLRDKDERKDLIKMAKELCDSYNEQYDGPRQAAHSHRDAAAERRDAMEVKDDAMEGRDAAVRNGDAAERKDAMEGKDAAAREQEKVKPNGSTENQPEPMNDSDP